MTDVYTPPPPMLKQFGPIGLGGETAEHSCIAPVSPPLPPVPKAPPAARGARLFCSPPGRAAGGGVSCNSSPGQQRMACAAHIPTATFVFMNTSASLTEHFNYGEQAEQLRAEETEQKRSVQ